MDQRVRFRTAHRRLAGSPHPPRPYPRNERRELSTRTEQASIQTPTTNTVDPDDNKLKAPTTTAHQGEIIIARCALGPAGAAKDRRRCIRPRDAFLLRQADAFLFRR